MLTVSPARAFALPVSGLGATAILAAALRRAWRGMIGGGRSSTRTPYGSQAYDPKTGLGRGAPGFQTNVKRIAVPPEIIARIRAGEEVSADEITRAQEKMQREQEAQARQHEQQGGSGNDAGKRKKRGGKR